MTRVIKRRIKFAKKRRRRNEIHSVGKNFGRSNHPNDRLQHRGFFPPKRRIVRGLRRFFAIFRLWAIFGVAFSQNIFFAGDKNLLNPKTLYAITEIGSELREKTGVFVKIFADETAGQTKNERDIFVSKLMQDEKRPFFLIFFVKNERKFRIIPNEKAKNLVDTEQIYENYIVPLLPNSKKIEKNQISAILLSAYSQLAYEISQKTGVILQKNIVDRSADGVFRAVNFIILCLIGISIFAIFWSRRRRNRA